MEMGLREFSRSGDDLNVRSGHYNWDPCDCQFLWEENPPYDEFPASSIMVMKIFLDL